MGLKEIFEIIVLIAVIAYIIWEHKLKKRLIKICYGLIEQNQKIEEQNELLRIIFSKEYEEMRRKHGIE